MGVATTDPKPKWLEHLTLTLPFLQPRNQSHPPEKPCLSPCHTELEEQLRTYWEDNE